jgi:hypothetical protein
MFLKQNCEKSTISWTKQGVHFLKYVILKVEPLIYQTLKYIFKLLFVLTETSGNIHVDCCINSLVWNYLEMIGEKGAW